MSNSGEYYNMDEIRCWIEEEAIFNDAYDAIENTGVKLGVHRQSLWPNCNSRINRHMELETMNGIDDEVKHGKQ